MTGERFSWRNPMFTYADVLTGARLIMLPYLVYALAAGLAGLAAVTLAAMILTDLIDGRIARRLGQARMFGAALDSGIDFVIIYTLFTTFFAIGTLPWWKWVVICTPAVLMAVTQLLYLVRAPEVSFAVAPAGKLVGAIQFGYLPFLLWRTFWSGKGWDLTADHIIFAALVIPTVVNTVDYARLLRALLRRPVPAGHRGGQP